mgnify:CR=1 FL=1
MSPDVLKLPDLNLPGEETLGSLLENGVSMLPALEIVKNMAGNQILAEAVETGAREVGKLFGVATDKDGFFAEAHPKLKPVDTTAAGVFLAGCCQSPKDIPDTVAQASAAAANSTTIRLTRLT